MEGNNEEICRLCLQKLFNVKSFDIFPQKTEGVHENVIPMRLAAVAAIEVIKLDALPKRICETCRYQLELSYSFRKKSQISDAKLRKHYKLLSLGKTSAILLNNEDNDDNYYQEEIYDDSLRFVEDFERSKREILKKEIRIEMEREFEGCLEKMKRDLQDELGSILRSEITKEIEEDVRHSQRLQIEESLRSELLEKAKQELHCEMQERLRREENANVLKDIEEFLRLKQLERNKLNKIMLLESSHGNQNTPQEMKADLEDYGKCEREKFQCLDKGMDNRGKDHVINKEAQSIKSLCTDVMSYEIRINQDIQIRESGTIIEESLEDISVFNRDEFVDEGSRDNEEGLEILKVLSYDCEEADNTEDNNMGEENNMEIVQSGKKSPIVTYVCVEPSKSQSIGRISNTPKTFKCKFCPVEVSTECSLKRHLRVHMNGEKSVACPECKIVVSCNSALRRHMVLHSEERRPYVCNICKKAFGQREILKRHENTQHRGLRRHKCPHCDREFSQKNSLTEHINQTHLGEPRKCYKCHLCSKSFFFSSGLSRHLSFHSGITYKCADPECVRSFTDRSSIKRHVLKVHGVEKAQQLLAQINLKCT